MGRRKTSVALNRDVRSFGPTASWLGPPAPDFSWGRGGGRSRSPARKGLNPLNWKVLCQTLIEPSSLERLVDVAPLAPDGLGDLGGAHSFLAQGDDAGVVEGDRAALVDALRLSGVDASALPVTDEAKLHLRDHAEHGQDHAAHRACGVDCGLKDPKAGSLLLQFMDEVEDVTSAASQSVQLDHHKHVAGPDEFQDRGQFGAPFAGLAGHLLGSDDRAASGLELLDLGRGVLVGGADACIADEMAWGVAGSGV